MSSGGTPLSSTDPITGGSLGWPRQDPTQNSSDQVLSPREKDFKSKINAQESTGNSLQQKYTLGREVCAKSETECAEEGPMRDIYDPRSRF